MRRQYYILYLAIFPLMLFAQNVDNKDYRNSISFKLDNDLFFKSDRYYSAGESFSYVSPIISKSPFTRLLVSSLNIGDVANYGLRMSHKIYTPTNPSEGGLKLGDMPYSASFDITHFIVLENRVENYRVTSSLSLGFFGEHAFGRQVQTFIHDITPSQTPLGWENQIKSDLLINYYFKLDKAIYNSEYLDLLASGAVNFGTLNTDIAISSTLRFGHMENYFESFNLRSRSDFKYWMELSYSAKFVAYNAHLQGGLFNTENIYTLPSSEMERLIHNFSLNLYLQYYKHRIIISANSISPEFNSSEWHNWIGIEYQYWF